MAEMTAVEWLIDKLSNIKAEDFNSILEVRLICQQAKAMEKQQIMDAYDNNKMGRVDYGEQYYNKTYGK
jgi:hypothetical protein